MFLWQAVDQGRIQLAEIHIAVFGRQTQDIDEAALMAGKGILGEDSEKAFELRDAGIQGFEIGLPHPADLAIFQGVDIKDTGCLIDHAVHVSDPPTRGRELYNVFKAIAVDGIAAEQTSRHEGGSFCYVAFLVEELLFFERAVMEEPGEMS